MPVSMPESFVKVAISPEEIADEDDYLTHVEGVWMTMWTEYRGKSPKGLDCTWRYMSLGITPTPSTWVR